MTELYTILGIVLVVLAVVIGVVTHPGRKNKYDSKRSSKLDSNFSDTLVLEENKQNNINANLPFTFQVERVIKVRNDIYAIGVVSDGVIREDDRVLISLANGQIIESEVDEIRSGRGEHNYAYPGDKVALELEHVSQYDLTGATIRKKVFDQGTAQTSNYSYQNNANKKFCRFCGTSYDASGKFCPNCGAQN